MSNDKVKRLQVYVEGTKQRIKMTTNEPKREFFERELRKTLAEIDRLTK